MPTIDEIISSIEIDTNSNYDQLRAAIESAIREARAEERERIRGGYDLDAMCEAFYRVIEAHAHKENPFHNPIDHEAQMALRILRGIVANIYLR